MSVSSAARGRTIRIFLADGSPNGVLTAEIMNWTGKVVFAPRARLPALVARPEVGRTGVYVLAGDDPQHAGRPMVYVGESDSVRERLLQHNADEGKDFFSRVCVVVFKDENLTKAHARYLESRLIGLAKLANRAKLANGTAPAFDLLPESDRSDMDFFVEQIALVLPVLGFDFAQPLPTAAAATSPGFASAGGGQAAPTFEMGAVGVAATATEADGKFVVLKGSTARLSGTPSWDSYKGLRDKLVADGKLVPGERPDALRFAEDVPFDSPSAAASVVCAGNQNGREAWRLKGNGQTYKQWQEGKIASSSQAASP